MRSVISFILVAIFSCAAQARVYHPRVLSWGELTRLPKTKRIAYLHEMQKVLVTFEKMQRRNHVAVNSDELGQIKSQVAALIRMSSVLPQAHADDTYEVEELDALPPQEEVHVLKPVSKKKKKSAAVNKPVNSVGSSVKATEPTPVPAPTPTPTPIPTPTPAPDSASSQSGGYMGVGAGLIGNVPQKKKAPTKAGWVDAPENMKKFYLPSQTKERAKPSETKAAAKGTDKATTSKASEAKSSIQETTSAAPTDPNHIPDPEKPANFSGESDPVKPSTSDHVQDPKEAVLPESGKAKFIVVPTTPFNPDGKCPEGLTWNSDSKTCLNLDYYDKDMHLKPLKAEKGSCAPKPDSCSQLTEKQADEARLRLAHTPSASICSEGGFFSTYKNPQNPKEGCNVVEKLDGVEKGICAAGEHPCNMNLFCVAAPFDDLMKERFNQAGLPFDKLNKDAIGKFDGDDTPAVPRGVCVKDSRNITQACVTEYNALLAGTAKGEMSIKSGGVKHTINLDGVKYKACDVLTFHSKAYDKLPYAEAWRAVKTSIEAKYNDTCGNADFRSLYCDDCALMKKQLFAAAKAVTADPCKGPTSADSEAPSGQSGDATK